VTQLDATSGASPFDAIKNSDERGDFWTGRDLMPLMQYARWEKFAEVIEKAKASLAIVEGVEQAAHHFATWGSDGGRWGNRRLEDYRLTRFGAYLVAMAGDDTKEAVARARVYFAVKTREAEVAPPMDYAALDINDPRAVMVLAQAAHRSAALAIKESERADRAEARVEELIPAAQALEAIEAGDGIRLKVFRKHYFPDVPEREFFEHLYRRRLLIDQRGRGEWNERTQARRDGWQHGHPTAEGSAYLYMHATRDRNNVRRHHARVKPGAPERALRDLLVKQGLVAALITTTDLAVRNP